MSSIDQRIVQMQFQNSQFESGVKTTMSTLDKLKAKLNFKGASKGLDELNTQAKSIDFSSMSGALDTIAGRFSNLGIIGMQVLQNITNAVMNTASTMARELTVQPMIDGFQEYETQLNSVQTILSNTSSKGTTIDQVNKALDELNTYADLTIYNFAEMTRNIGTFTAAGVDLDKSVTSIKGIANLAAASGSSSQQASTAMYQLSQAIAAGKVQLQDWNSVVNAGMGGELFQNALKRTAEHFGTNVDGMIEKYGSFRESLTKGEWLTTDVLTETLKQISGAYTEADLLQQGYSEQQAKDIVQLAKTATDAATKVKTFTQLIDTAKEALGSGWATTWRTVFGDFEEAQDLWTNASNVINDMIGKQADARNALVQGWKDLGGRTQIIEGVSTAFDSLTKILSTVQQAFRDVFPPTTSEQLFNLSKGFNDLMKSLAPSEQTLGKISSVFKGLFSAIDLVKQAVVAVVGPIGEFIGELLGLGGGSLLDIAAGLGDFVTGLDEAAKKGKLFEELGSAIRDTLNRIKDAFSNASGIFDSFGKGFSKAFDVVKDVASKIGEVLSGVIDWIKENFTLGDIFAGLAGGGIVVVAKKISGILDTVKETFEGFFGKGGGDKGGGFLDDVKGKVTDILDGLHDSLSAFTQGIKVASLVGIAGAVALLTSSVKKLSEIDPVKVAGSLVAIRIMIAELNSGFKGLVKTLSKYDSKGVVKAAAGMVAMSIAINLLADAMVKMKDLDAGQIAKGLAAIAVGIGAMAVGIRIIGKSNVSLKTSVAIIAIAEACKILADAVTKFSGLSWDEIGRGLAAMGGALAEIVAALALLDKTGGGLSEGAAIWIVAQALGDIGDALKNVSDMSWDEISRGLVAMGGALAEVAILTGLLGKIAGGKGLVAAVSIVIAVQALKPLADALSEFGNMNWDEIAKGLVGMGGALGEVAIIIGILGNVAGLNGVAGALAVVLTVQALAPLTDAFQRFAGMEWGEIGKGLVGMGSALAVVAGISGVLGTVAGLGAILGAGAIFLTVQSLADLVDPFQRFAGMEWGEIGKGLAGMAGALGVVAGISGVLGNVAGVGALLGAGAILLAVQSLNDLIDPFQKFAGMDWGEILKGCVGMAGALAVVGGMSTAIGTLGGLASLMGAGTISIVVQGLGELADVFQKFGSMDWGSILKGIAGMAGAMGAAGLGALLNTFSGIGADVIGNMAPGLSALADAVQKWSGVSVPLDLGLSLQTLAAGVNAFTMGGWGADAMATAAPALGQFADSVQKWAGVTVPPDLGTSLQSLASGVQAFSFAFLGGFSISVITGPLGELADSVQKWSGISIPTDVGTSLKSLADGIGAFTFAFVGGWSLGAITGPLGDLGNALRSWNGITIPTDIGTTLKTVADAANSFTGVDSGAISSAASGLSAMAGPLQSLSGIDVSNFSLQIGTLGTSLSDAAVGISGAAPAFAAAMTTIVSTITSQGPLIGASFTGIMTGAAAAISGSAGMFTSAAMSVTAGFGSSLSSGIQAGTSMAVAVMTSGMATLINAGTNALNAGRSRFQQLGLQMMQALANGIRAGQGAAVAAARTAITTVNSSVTVNTSNWYMAGYNMTQGLANGIRAGQSSAISAAASVASAALRSAKNALGEKSPSKITHQYGVFFDQGLINGINELKRDVEKTAGGIGTGAVTSLKASMAALQNGTLQSKAAITPVFSPGALTSLSSGASLKLNANLATASVTSPFNTLRQGMMSDNERLIMSNKDVVDSIKTLREEMGTYAQAIQDSETAMYVDGKKLASSIARPMNTALGIASRRQKL